jgi:hypothetical protein
MFFVGFDPGGKNAFGWVVLRLVGSELRCVASGTCSGARQAVDESAAHCPEGGPVVVSIDAPMYWVDDGDRQADVRVRDQVVASGGKPGTVNHVNSLRGACLVQGVQAARFAHEKWPRATINEAHPKALFAVYPAAREFLAKTSNQLRQGASDHEQDAILAAYAAHAVGVESPGWQDLVELDKDPYSPSGVAIEYWFPKPV